VRSYFTLDWPVITKSCYSGFALLFDLLLLGLTLVKAVRVWRTGGRVPILSLLVRDGVLAFVAVAGTFSSKYCRTASLRRRISDFLSERAPILCACSTA
jgi:hypothetical protein